MKSQYGAGATSPLVHLRVCQLWSRHSVKVSNHLIIILSAPFLWGHFCGLSAKPSSSLKKGTEINKNWTCQHQCPDSLAFQKVASVEAYVAMYAEDGFVLGGTT